MYKNIYITYNIYITCEQCLLLCCPWRNSELSHVTIITGWQGAISMLSLAFLCWPKGLAGVCPRWETFYAWRSCWLFYQ